MAKGLKTGGRVAGTPNKSTQALFDKCDELGIDPFTALLQIARDGDKEETRLTALKEVCSYLYPKRKAIEHSTDEEKGFRVVLEDYLTKVK